MYSKSIWNHIWLFSIYKCTVREIKDQNLICLTFTEQNILIVSRRRVASTLKKHARRTCWWLRMYNHNLINIWKTILNQKRRIFWIVWSTLEKCIHYTRVAASHVYSEIIPERYLWRLPLCKYSKQSNRSCIPATIFSPWCRMISPCVSAQYPRNQTILRCLIFIRETTSRRNDMPSKSWYECNFFTATMPSSSSPCEFSTIHLSSYIIWIYTSVYIYVIVKSYKR